jgi:NADH-quinone oxidoreductase subunit L
VTESFPLYFIVVFPLLAGAALFAGAGRLRRGTAWMISMGGLAASGVILVEAVFDGLLPLVQEWGAAVQPARMVRLPHPRLVSSLGTWVQAGGVAIPLGFQLDTLGAVFSGLALTVALLVSAFLWGVDWKGSVWVRHLAAINVVAGGVLGFVLAGDLVIALTGWGLAGAAMSLMVGLATHESEAPRAARTAWLVSRLGDILLLLAVLVVIVYTRLTSFQGLERGAWVLSHPRARWVFGLKPGFIVVALIGGAALCRMAQFPLHLWLAKASSGAGPTGALLLGGVAPTGLFLVLRFNQVAGRSPVALSLMGCAGALSALLLALTSCAQHNLRKALMYAVAAQLGVGLVAAGSGNLTGAVFHVVTVGLAGSGLLLAASAVERQLAGLSDIREMGGLLRPMRWTGGAFLLGCLTVGGLWPLSGGISTAGVVEKSLVLVFERTPGIMRLKPEPGATLDWIVSAVTLAASAVAAFAVMRVFFRVFTGPSNYRPDREVREAGRSLAGPAMMLTATGAGAVALVSVLSSLAGARSPFFEWSGIEGLSVWLSSSLPAATHWVVREPFRQSGTGDLVTVVRSYHLYVVLVTALAIAGAMALAAWFFLGRARASGGRLISTRSYRWFYNLLHADLGAEAGLRVWSDRLLYGLGWVERSIGERLISDGLLIRLPARIVELVGWASSRLQQLGRRSALSLSVAGLALLAVLAVRPPQAVVAEVSGRTVTLSVEGLPASTPGPWQVRWDLDGDGDWDREGLSVTHTFPTSGQKKIVVQIEDRRFKSVTRLQKTVRVESSRRQASDRERQRGGGR